MLPVAAVKPAAVTIDLLLIQAVTKALFYQLSIFCQFKSFWCALPSIQSTVS
jgi:hypothetical protein